MANSKGTRQAKALGRLLEEQGQSKQWLADQTGYTRSYVSNILSGKVPFTEEFQRKAMTALATTGTVTVQYRGKAVQVPENVYKNAAGIPPIAVESVYEEAWKRAWLAENAATTLAVAAERAWQAAGDLAAA